MGRTKLAIGLDLAAYRYIQGPEAGQWWTLEPGTLKVVSWGKI